MKRIVSIIIAVLAVIALVLPTAALTRASAMPYFNIVEVVKDQTVTIEAFNFPANDTFQVTMGKYGTYGIDGVVIGTTDSGTSGSFKTSYTIPASFAGMERIAIRLQSSTSGYYAYNWFWNSPSTATSRIVAMSFCEPRSCIGRLSS